MTAAAIAFARRVVAEKRPLALARERDDKLAALRADPGKFDELAAKVARRVGGPLAPARARCSRCATRSNCRSIGARARACELPRTGRERGIEGAASYLLRRTRSRQGRRAAGGHQAAREIKRAAVIGAGTMGGGIAMCFANAGIPVTVVETSQEALDARARRPSPRTTRRPPRAAACKRRGGARMSAVRRHDRPCRRRRSRPHRRGGVRGHGRQEARCSQRSTAGQARRGAGDQHVLSRRQRDCAHRRSGPTPWSACTSSARRT